MPNQHANPMLGWHPPAELSAWVKAEAEQRGTTVSDVLTHAVREYQDMVVRLQSAGRPRCEWCDGPRCPFPATERVTCQATGDSMAACAPHAEWLLSLDPDARRGRGAGEPGEEG